MSRKPDAPSGISASARRVWDSVLENYTMRPDEVELLRTLVKEMTTAEQIEAVIADQDMLMPGSHGGVIANPLLVELRHRRTTIMNLHKALKLPELMADDDEDEHNSRVVTPMSRSEAGRKAAQARHRREG